MVKYHKQKFEKDMIIELETYSNKGKYFWKSFKRFKGNIQSLPIPNEIQNYFVSLYNSTSNAISNFEEQNPKHQSGKFEITEKISIADIK